MSHPRPPQLLAVAAVGMAAAFAAAVPAGASEGPAATTPPPAPWTLTAPTFGPAAGSPAQGTLPSAKRSKPRITKARVVPHSIRKGKRAGLRLSLPQAGQVLYKITRQSRPGRGRVVKGRATVTAGAISVRLPRGAKGRSLAPGSYSVSVVVVDSLGERSRTVRRSLVVRPAHR